MQHKSPIWAIFKKELQSYFVSPIAYIVMVLFLLISGWLFFSTFFIYNQAEMRGFFSLLPLIFSFIIPAVTMRLFSEEINIGSYETLITLPVTLNDVILGKFLGALIFMVVVLFPTLIYAITVSLLGDLDWGPVIGGYLGAILLAGAYIAIGMFASSLTRNQIVAFIIALGISFFLAFLDKMLFFLPAGVVNFFQYLGSDYHFQNISKGVIDSRDLIYFLSVGFVSLYGNRLVMLGKK